MRRSLARGFAFVWAAATVLCGCGGGSEPSGSVDESILFPPPTQAEIEAVQSEWNARDLNAHDVVLLNLDTANPNYDVRIYEHKVGANTHVGAITVPKNAAPGTVPVLVHADGLAQHDPTFDLGRNLEMAGELAHGVVLVMPAFRGRTLIFKGVSYPAAGDFCDAFDGAADDAIALLTVAEQEVAAANMDRVMVRGGSRGGNTALLLAARDERVKLVLAIAAPTDFNRLEVRVRNSDQFRCQFIDNKTPEESRMRILASSPLHFPVLANVRRVFIFHGSEDNVVPLWNATDMAAALEVQGVPTSFEIFDGYGHGDLGSAPGFREAQRAAVAELFTME